MMIRCPRRMELGYINDTECPAYIMQVASSEDLAPCLECEHGRKLISLCPYKGNGAAQARPHKTEARPEPQVDATPAPRPAPVRTMADEIESLRNALAYLVPQKYTTLGVSFVEMVAQRYGMTTGILETAEAAGLTVKKVRKTVKIMQNKALWDFIKI